MGDYYIGEVSIYNNPLPSQTGSTCWEIVVNETPEISDGQYQVNHLSILMRLRCRSYFRINRSDLLRRDEVIDFSAKQSSAKVGEKSNIVKSCCHARQFNRPPPNSVTITER